MCYAHNWDYPNPKGWQRVKEQLHEQWVEVHVAAFFNSGVAFLDDSGEWRDAKTFKAVRVILWRPI